MIPAKRLVLGSALWGWGMAKPQVFKMLDRYVERGGKWVDTAVNYPINKQPQDHGKAVAWLAEWLQTRAMPRVAIMLKIGALDNMGGSDSLLTPQHIATEVKHARALFGSSLATVAVHWDNRGEAAGDRAAIADTLGAFAELKAQGLQIGFSGIRCPELYKQEAPALRDDWWIQVKENAYTQEARIKLQRLFPDANYLAYGINMGGIKAEVPGSKSSATLRGITPPEEFVNALKLQLVQAVKWKPSPKNLNELAMYQAYANSALTGIVAGPRTVAQLESTIDYWKALVASATSEERKPHE